MTVSRDHRGWYRPRSLPHFDTPERPQFVTFRAADSLPAAVAQARSGEGPAVYRRRIEAALDAGAGACLLSRPELAGIVLDGLIHGCGRTHDMHAFVVMPNHVHVLTTFRQGCRPSDVVRGWKSYSARQINAILGCEGAFWQRDYFDRYIRDETHFERVRAYVEDNPVTAGLTNDAESWPFSSLSWSAGVRADN
jgi:putative DNA methylase